MTLCPHGDSKPHGDPTAGNWCAGPLQPMAEPWRGSLEFQMNETGLFRDLTEPIEPFTRFAEAEEIDGSQVPDDVNVVSGRPCDHANNWCALYGDLTTTTPDALQALGLRSLPDEMSPADYTEVRRSLAGEPLRTERLTEDELRTVKLLHAAIPTTTDPEVAAREGVGLWQLHSPTTAEVVLSYEEATRQQMEYARRRYAEPWGTILAGQIGDYAGEPIRLPETTVDTLADFVPLGWMGFGEVHWWGDPETPIYNEMCSEWRKAGRPTPPIMRG